ncbi:MAG TPA: hypothetical protein PKZ70_04805 [Candidatus Atribacteria bacterium]|nr:hypothetical protein [Candidatus Atribacteria bacterium]
MSKRDLALIIIFSWIIMVSFFLNSSTWAAEKWELLGQTTIKVIAEVKPYISISISSPVTSSDNIPVIDFNCDRGPGIYQAKYPLDIRITSNSGMELYFEANSLRNEENKLEIAPEKLSFKFGDKANLISFSSKNAVKAFESFTFIDQLYHCDFQLEIGPETKAGTYEGTIIVQVLPKV